MLDDGRKFLERRAERGALARRVFEKDHQRVR
jgi:hypothetical protein